MKWARHISSWHLGAIVRGVDRFGLLRPDDASRGPNAISATRVRLAVSAVAIATALGCSATTGSKILVKVEQKDLAVNKDINHLTLTVTDGAHSYPPLGYDLATAIPDARSLVLPASLEIERASAASPWPLTIVASADYDGTPVVSRAIRVNVTEDTVSLVLDLRCAKTDCLPGETCLPGLGCKEIPTYPDVDGDGHPNGPECDCQSRFPYCVGITYRHKICKLNATPLLRPADCSTKTNVVADFDPENRQFVQVRISGIDHTRRRLSRDDTYDENGVFKAFGKQLVWRRTDWFDAHWQPSGRQFYEPEKVRLDETQLPGDSPPALMYREVNEAKATDDWQPQILEHRDTWMVVPLDWKIPPLVPDDTPKLIKDELMAGEFVQARMAEQDGDQFLESIRCYHRLNVEVDDAFDPPKTTSSEEIFCFAPAIGKVWEYTGDTGEEFLSSFKSPCGEFTPAP